MTDQTPETAQEAAHSVYDFGYWSKKTAIGTIGGAALLLLLQFRRLQELAPLKIMLWFLLLIVIAFLIAGPIIFLEVMYRRRKPGGNPQLAFLNFVGSVKGAGAIAAVVGGVSALVAINSDSSVDWSGVAFIPILMFVVSLAVGRLYRRILFPGHRSDGLPQNDGE